MSCPPKEKKNYTQMFIATLFVIAKYQKQPKYLYAAEMVNKL